MNRLGGRVTKRKRTPKAPTVIHGMHESSRVVVTDSEASRIAGDKRAYQRGMPDANRAAILSHLPRQAMALDPAQESGLPWALARVEGALAEMPLADEPSGLQPSRMLFDVDGARHGRKGNAPVRNTGRQTKLDAERIEELPLQQGARDILRGERRKGLSAKLVERLYPMVDAGVLPVEALDEPSLRYQRGEDEAAHGRKALGVDGTPRVSAPTGALWHVVQSYGNGGFTEVYRGARPTCEALAAKRNAKAYATFQAERAACKPGRQARKHAWYLSRWEKRRNHWLAMRTSRFSAAGV